MDTKKSTPSSQNARTTMTMHLAQGLTTVRTRRPKKKKLSVAQLDQLRIEWRAYNKRMRKAHCHSAQFEEFDDYVAYTRGEMRNRKQKNTTAYQPTKSPHRETANYPSLSNNVAGFAPRKEPNVYTGDLIVGIGTMHKSNAVPIMRGTNEAKDLARMRR